MYLCVLISPKLIPKESTSKYQDLIIRARTICAITRSNGHVTDITRSGWWININTLRPRQNGRHFPDDIFKCIFLNENVWSSIGISLKFVSRVPIDNKPALVQIMAWRRPGDKPLSEPMMTSLPTHICVTRPQWVNPLIPADTVNALVIIYCYWRIIINIQCHSSE